MKLVAFILLLVGGVAMAGEVAQDSATLQKALRIYGVANFNLEYGPHRSPSGDAKWAYDYVHSQREKAVGGAIGMIAQEAQKLSPNEQLLFGLNLFLCRETNSFGETAHEDARSICESVRDKEIVFFREGKDPSFSEEAAEWKAWWTKFKKEEYIQNSEMEIKPGLEDALNKFFFGTNKESKIAAVKMDALPRRHRLYVGILMYSTLIDSTPQQRRIGIYLKRCMELIAGKRVPVSDPHVGDNHKSWQNWLHSINQTIDYNAVMDNWPNNFWEKADRNKIMQPPVKE